MRIHSPRNSISKKALMLAVAHAALLASATASLAATDTWTGAGADGNWTNPLNWGGTAPVAGDNLVFSGATRLTTTNNFPAGTLFNSITFDSTAGNFSLGGNAMLLGGSANGSIVNNSTNTETLTLGLTLSNLTASPLFGGNHFINAAAGTIALNPTGGLQRTLGSTAQFAGNITTTTLTNDSTGILGGWANFGASINSSDQSQGVPPVGYTYGTDIASVSAGQVVAYPNYTNLTFDSSGTIFTVPPSPGVNLKLSGATGTATGTLTVPGVTDINSLTETDSPAETVGMTVGQTLRLGTTGLLFRTSNANDNITLTIGNTAGVGTLTAGGPNNNTPGEIVFDSISLTDPNNGIAVNSVITDNGTGKVTIVKTGTSATVLQPGASNTFTGDIYIDQGKLRDQTAGAYGQGQNIYVYNGGQAYFQTADLVRQNIFLSGMGVNEGGAFLGGAMRLAGNGVQLTGTITLTGDTRITARSATGTGGALMGKITGASNLELGGAGTGVLYVTNPANNWTGNTTVSSGTLRLGANEVLPSGAGKGNVIINGDANGGGATILDLFGHTQTVNGLSVGATTAAANVTNSAGVATLNVGANNTTGEYDGIFTTSATGSLNINKVGTGTLTITNGGAGSFNGNANVAAGSLVLNNGAGFTANLSTSGGAAGGKLDVSSWGPSGFSLSGQTLAVNSSPAGGGVVGSLNVNGGTLSGTGTVGGLGDTVSITGGSEITPGASAADGSVGTLTLSSLATSGGDIHVDATAAGDKIVVSGTATFNGASISVAPNTTAGTYTILTAGLLVDTTAPTLSVASLGRSTYALSFSTLNTIKLTVTGGSANLTWNSTTGGGDGTTWDIQNSQNFSSTGATGNANQYYEADNVTFNDANAGHYTVTLNSTVNPASVTFANSSGDYVINGGGSISGSTALTLNGSRSVTLNNGNNYTGATNLNNGTLVLNNSNAIGTGPLNINGGSIGSSTGSPLVLGSNNLINVKSNFTFSGPSDLSFGASTIVLNSNATINVATGNLTFGGPVVNGSAGDGFTKTGNGTLILSVANLFAGTLNINGGVVQLGNINALGAWTGATNINGGTLNLNNLALNTTETFNIAGTGFNNQGAIVNNAANQTGNEISRLNLIGNASIGGTGRWDFRNNAPMIDLAGFNLTKVGANQISIVGATIRNSGATTGTIEVSNGFITLETLTSTLGNNGAFQFDSNITLQLNANTGGITWPMTFLGNNTIGNSAAGNATVTSPAILKGNITFVPVSTGIASPGSTFPLNWAGNITESGGSFAVNKFGANTMVLSGPGSSFTAPAPSTPASSKSPPTASPAPTPVLSAPTPATAPSPSMPASPSPPAACRSPPSTSTAPSRSAAPPPPLSATSAHSPSRAAPAHGPPPSISPTANSSSKTTPTTPPPSRRPATRSPSANPIPKVSSTTPFPPASAWPSWTMPSSTKPPLAESLSTPAPSSSPRRSSATPTPTATSTSPISPPSSTTSAPPPSPGPPATSTAPPRSTSPTSPDVLNNFGSTTPTPPSAPPPPPENPPPSRSSPRESPPSSRARRKHLTSLSIPLRPTKARNPKPRAFSLRRANSTSRALPRTRPHLPSPLPIAPLKIVASPFILIP